MKKALLLFGMFLVIFIVYFAVATKFTFKPKWAIDYFNPLAKSLLDLRFDIQNPAMTYDLVNYNGRWYIPWGVLTSLFLIPFQLIKGRYVPILYLSLFFSSLNVVIVYLLLERIKKEFLPQISFFGKFIFLILFAFGTTHFYVGTLGSAWHVNQMVTAFLATLGIYVILKKNRKTTDYLMASFIFSVALLGRFTIAMLLVLPIFLYLWDNFLTKKLNLHGKIIFWRNFLIIFGLPLLFFVLLSFSYNYLRFGNPLEYGYSYIHESAYLAQLREKNGFSSFKNLINNSWYMLFEIPSIGLSDKFHLNFNLKGNSIFFLTPPFLAAFLASPIKRIKKKISLDPYVFSLWLAAIITIIPSLLHYSTGWMQFGYRYTLDITVLLLLLSIFGIKGKINLLYVMGVAFSICVYFWGIVSLM